MNKNSSNLIEFLKNRNKIQFNGNIDWKNEKNELIDRDGINEENSNEFNLYLKISTNTKSPIQKEKYGNWNEIIDGSCFDDSLNDELFCFLDHKIDSEHTLASTRNKTMEIFKTDNAYIAKVKLFRNNTEHKRVIEKIESGLLTTNSFIFQPIETDYIDSNDENVDLTVIHKKGKLISVDPVILAFYPTNTIEYKSEVIEMEIEKKQEKPMEQNAPLKVEMTADEAASFYKQKYEELLAEKETQAEIENDDSKPSTETEPQVKEPNGEPANLEEEKEEEKEIKKEIEDIESREVQNILTKRNDIKKRILEMNNTSRRNYKITELTKKIFAPNYSGYIDRKKLFNEDELLSLNEHLDSYEKENSNFYHQINLISNGRVERAAIDGSSIDQGLAFISYINDPDVKTELERVLPEIEGAEGIALDTLDVVKKDLLIPNSTSVTSIKEGANATEFNGTTVSVLLEPIRYSQEYSVNPKIANYAQIMEKQTLNGKNGIITAIRKEFYKNLFLQKNVAWATAKPTWNGGIVKESLIKISQPTKLTLADIDILISNLEAEYGDGVVGVFKMFMHPDTKTYLMKESRDAKNPDWIIEKNQMSYRGINIITSKSYPYKVNPVTGEGTNDEIPVVIARKDCIVYRGLTFVIEDNPYINMSKGLATRYQSTRGEVKLIDPFLNTMALKFGEVAVASTLNEEEAQAFDNAEMLRKAYNYDNLDKKSKKIYDTRIAELENKEK